MTAPSRLGPGASQTPLASSGTRCSSLKRASSTQRNNVISAFDSPESHRTATDETPNPSLQRTTQAFAPVLPLNSHAVSRHSIHLFPRVRLWDPLPVVLELRKEHLCHFTYRSSATHPRVGPSFSGTLKIDAPPLRRTSSRSAASSTAFGTRSGHMTAITSGKRQ